MTSQGSSRADPSSWSARNRWSGGRGPVTPRSGIVACSDLDFEGSHATRCCRRVENLPGMRADRAPRRVSDSPPEKTNWLATAGRLLGILIDLEKTGSLVDSLEHAR